MWNEKLAKCAILVLLFLGHWRLNIENGLVFLQRNNDNFFGLFVDGDGAVDGNWWDSEVKVATAKENGSQEKGQLTITKMRSVHKQKEKMWKRVKKKLKGKLKEN